MKVNATAFLAGIVFAIGLAVGGMTQPAKIVGFLDVTGAWDLSLAGVMGDAVIVYAIVYRLTRRRPRPVFAQSFMIPIRRDLDGPLIAGAALFGIGWGVGSFCPGPAIVSLAWLDARVLIFIAAMCFEMILHRWATARPSQRMRATAAEFALTSDA
jgi:hypothetical protein